jgi:hypothetical protein
MMAKREYFIVAHSFAAPFVSDESTGFVWERSAALALMEFAKTYRHPAGLYAAAVYLSADAYHKDAKPLAQWLCNHEQAKRRLTAGMSGYGYLGHAPGSFEINGTAHTIEDPKGGSVVNVVPEDARAVDVAAARSSGSINPSGGDRGKASS